MLNNGNLGNIAAQARQTHSDLKRSRNYTQTNDDQVVQQHGEHDHQQAVHNSYY